MDAGIILLDKPAGISSAQALAALKRRLELSKVGHAGTLDPAATGLLVVLSGAATRLAAFATGGRKSYCGVLYLGLSTSTDDLEGVELSRSEAVPSFAAVAAAAARFVGRIDQVPPQVSAVKVQGQRAYKLARQGAAFELSARTVEIYDLKLQPQTERQIAFELDCSSGTYIRAWARDLGHELGCGACLAELRRKASEPFQVSQAKTLDQLSADDIVSWERLFPALPTVTLDAAATRRLQVGDLRDFPRWIADRPGVAQADRLICRAADSQLPVALLVRKPQGWSFAYNQG